jgi:trigger factor
MRPARGRPDPKETALALIEGCKHQLDITIPADAVAEETQRVALKVQAKARLRGFRPGKAPMSVIKSNFSGDIREEVLQGLVPKYIEKACEKENLRVVSRPDIKDLHFHEGESVHFKAEFEVAPEIELKNPRGLPVTYAEPTVADADIDERIASIREGRAEFVNVDPRPAVEGDHCLVDLTSISGVDGEPMRQQDINIEIGGKDTFTQFSEALAGVVPGESREAEVTYPENYAAERLSGRTVRFRIDLKQIRLRELPELNDELAKDIGDFQTLDELREEVRKAIFREREYLAQTQAKNDLVDQLVSMHEFPVPEAYVDSQIETAVESQLRSMKAQGVDVSKIKLDWEALRRSQYDKAKKDVMGSLLLAKVASSESIHVTQDEMDAEIQRLARQRREPVAATRMNLEKDGSLNRIANRILTDKTLNFLFEHAVKSAPAPAAE